MPRSPLERLHEISENNFVIEQEFTNYLKERFQSSSDKHFLFNYLLKYAIVREISPETGTLITSLQA